jgi:5,10-methylene-tetrahydrofolate dehydrogenase/methenyl tetrahydrofolate cyclohydrolase
MKISGNKLADPIRGVIQHESLQLVKDGITPHLVILTLGDEAGWETYVNQKLKWAERLAMKATLKNLKDATQDEVVTLINELNSDEKVHGIIVQRPLPSHLDNTIITNSISPDKDVDGFRADSPFEVPVWLAVKHILSHISVEYEDSLNSFLKSSTIVVIGKGETAGAPIADGIKKDGGNPQIIDTNTSDPQSIISSANIIISCVGKDVISSNCMHSGQIIIGVGIHTNDGKLLSDFNEYEAETKNVIYTPTPGGVGPLNLTFLFQNVLQAAQFSRNILVN